MAAYEIPYYSSITPIEPIVNGTPLLPPPSTPSPFISASPPSLSNAGSDAPALSAPPPSVSYTPPPPTATQPPLAPSTPPVVNTPPTASYPPPPTEISSAPTSDNSPPNPSSPNSGTSSPSAPPPTPPLPPQPPSAVPPLVSPPPLLLLSPTSPTSPVKDAPPPPLIYPSPPPPSPSTAPPPSQLPQSPLANPPTSSSSLPPPPPPLANPPTSSSSLPPPPPPLANPPTSSSSLPPPPPPLANPQKSFSPPSPPPPTATTEPPLSSGSPPPIAELPKSTPPPLILVPPSGFQSPPPGPSLPPPILSPSPLPSMPAVQSPTITRSPPALPLPLPTGPLGKPSTQMSPGAGRSSNSVGRESSNSSKSNGITSGNVATIAVVVGLFMLAFVGLAVFVKKRRRPIGPNVYAGSSIGPLGVGYPRVSGSSYQGPTSAPHIRYSSGSHGFAYSSSELGLGHSKLWFTYDELSAITNGFSIQYLLGEGGFGCVYKGSLKDGREVAVKQLKMGGSQGEREFKAEVDIISRVHHRHLVSLVGYCIAEHNRLLVYDYVPNNTLYYHLHVRKGPAMDWTMRVKVAAGASRGIAYLHEDCHPRIIHRDIKSSNILLDNNFEAQVSDFGLARLAMDANAHVSTRVMGTFGYLAPEYASTGKLTAKSDVYSFGVVLLELVTGRKPVDDSQPLGDEGIVEWARPLLSNALESGNFEELTDPRLEKNYQEKEIFRMIEAAAACIRHSASRRPRMGQVVRALDNLGDLDLNNGVKPGQSRLFNSEPQTEEIERFQRMAFSSHGYSGDSSHSSWKSRRDL